MWQCQGKMRIGPGGGHKGSQSHLGRVQFGGRTVTFYVDLTQGGVIWGKQTPVEKMPPPPGL